MWLIATDALRSSAWSDIETMLPFLYQSTDARRRQKTLDQQSQRMPQDGIDARPVFFLMGRNPF
jgi:hypothetical protein